MDTARSIVHSVTHYVKNTDLYLMMLGLVCSIYGMFLIYSATLNPVTALDGSTKNLYVQGAAIILGLAAFIALSLIDLENLGDLWKIFVIGNILLQFLLFTPLGTEVNGQRAWLNLGVTSLQPGELGKLIFIFTIAAHMTEIQDHITEWRGLVSVGLHTLVMMGAVVLSSGDTGMAIQYLMIAVIMLFSAGLPLKWLGIAAGVGIASVPILWNYVLKDYQKTRILVLFDPSIDVEQSRQATYGKIAIGSGQFTGQGWTNGTMTQMQYVPENQTDYIFSVAGEELGFLGCLLIIILLASTLKYPLQSLAEKPGFGWINIIGVPLISILIVFALLYWVGMARIVRSQVLTLKESEYVTAARALGAGTGRIIKKHILTNCIGTLIVTTTLQIPSAIFTESFLSFLGIGVSAPMPSLGSLASTAIDGLQSYPYRLFAPAIAISVVILSFNLFGDGLRDAFDPKLKN